jgi:pimeloyl-ACP methyl ester carboxylesterase
MDSAELSWGHLISDLAKCFRVIAPNWPGYGGSAWSERRRTTYDLVSCVGQLLDYWFIPTASIVGFSMGGGAALGFALSRPNRVEHLILVSSYGIQSKALYHKLVYLFVHTPGMSALSRRILRCSRYLTRVALRGIMRQRSSITEELLDLCYERIREPDAGKAFLAWQRSEILWSGLRTCYADKLSGLKLPTLFIHGEDDPFVPLSAIRLAADRVADASLCVFDEAGHWPQREEPERFLKELLKFDSLHRRTLSSN